MLISCPKCHSIYEIPDDLIGKSGRNFRCQNCATVWHALRSDALGYEEEELEPYVEPITVSEPPKRNYPANRDDFNVPADGKSGRKTHSSQEVLAAEGDPLYERPSQRGDASKQGSEITLTSDYGTSFTISMTGEEEAPSARRPYLNPQNEALSANQAERLSAPQTFKGYKKTMALLFLILLTVLSTAFRREIVIFFPEVEAYYNKAGLSGLNNSEYLRFDEVKVEEITTGGKNKLKISAVVSNPSFYTTRVPAVTVSGSDKTFAPVRPLLKGGEKTTAEFEVDLPENKNTINLTLGFAKP